MTTTAPDRAVCPEDEPLPLDTVDVEHAPHRAQEILEDYHVAQRHFHQRMIGEEPTCRAKSEMDAAEEKLQELVNDLCEQIRRLMARVEERDARLARIAEAVRQSIFVEPA